MAARGRDRSFGSGSRTRVVSAARSGFGGRARGQLGHSGGWCRLLTDDSVPGVGELPSIRARRCVPGIRWRAMDRLTEVGWSASL
jgi:hypothetical protein